MTSNHSRLSQQQSLQQTQTLSPQQLQVVRLLELPTLEMEERVRAELQDNPALEETASDTSPEQESRNDDSAAVADEENTAPESQEDLILGDYLTEDDIPDYKLQQTFSGNATRAEDIPFSESTSFYEELKEQLSERTLTEHEIQLAEYLIGSLDDDGLLRKPLSEIEDELAIYMGIDSTEEQLQNVLRILQDFDPPGIAARNLQECLLIQLRKRPASPMRKTAEDILTRCYDDFTRKRKDLIARRLNLQPEECDAAYNEITRLNPRPGNALGETLGKASQVIVPDFLVELDEDQGIPRLILNDSRMPQLRVNADFAQMLQSQLDHPDKQNKESREAMTFLKQKIDTARNFISAVQQRQQTLLATMQAIIDLQRPFFLEGDESLLRPMILRDVADRTGLDISTISRVSNSKWVQTPYGIFPLKHFFIDGITLSSGEEMTSREIRRILKERIDTEDKTHPLTDEELCAILQKEGYPLARRTVAKYRMQLQIPVARLRK